MGKFFAYLQPFRDSDGGCLGLLDRFGELNMGNFAVANRLLISEINDKQDL